ncbi:MAG: oligosaccharide flippase family protein, partial [Thermococcus sp.]|nr:oligosaccharide flippase family protein [Thermococcus sp.]
VALTTPTLTLRRLLARNDSLLKHAVIVFVASGVGSVLNYLYQLFMGRMLGPEQYGIFGALISLTYIFTVPAQTIQVSTAKSVSKLRAIGSSGDIGFLIRHMVKRVSLVSFLSLLAIVAASSLIRDFFRIPSVVPVIVVGIAFSFRLLEPVFSGSLQGLQRFVRLGAVQNTNFGSKLIFGVTLVSLGFGVEGALTGLIIGAGLGILVGAYFLRDVLQRTPANKAMPGISSYSAYMFLAFLFMALFYNIDVILVKRFFDPAQAGYYVAASTLARAIFFGSVAITGAMFPKVSASHENGNGVLTGRLLKDALLYTGLLAGGGALMLNLFPSFLTSLLYGSAYEESIKLVGLFSIGMFFFSLIYVLALYQLALGRKRFLPLLGIGAVAEVAGIVLFHTTLRHVVSVFTVVMGLILVGMVAVVAMRSATAFSGGRKWID